ncbi:jg5885 [Pararge aegeria aegeria]|uniref:Jg5885 protein n=1 Tax=Pararge aegeria aegeria TaxID=348720 RepID=A0A8S4RF34_9NEOP|nr:jg5885 [Pararge aegeria aegeria]
MDVGVPRCWNGDHAKENAALVGPNEVDRRHQRAAGNKRPRTVDFGTPHKRPMSSSGLQSLEAMMTVSIILKERCTA